ncbi:MAG: Wzz/FepE/Etk N-terminal domain-containing protein [Planctomycetota bacterium]|nr:Wzz/FepE/Etk N-terminal domain-containing protein [Planctomycetota bacterium]
MSNPTQSNLNVGQIFRTLKRSYLLWTVPTVAMTLLAVVYALVRPIEWKATQSLVVRDEAGGNSLTRAGRFDTTDAMKAAQETIVQMSNSLTVVKAALAEVGPPSTAKEGAAYPTKFDIEKLQGSITVSPPKGSEFGRNEVIYLSVDGPTRQRAIDLNNAVYKQLEHQMQELRKAKAQSLILELERATDLAQDELKQSTARLETVEKSVGRDLDELRTLTESGAGGSNLRSSINQLRDELRRVQLAHDTNAEQLRLLASAVDDTKRLNSAPQRLFETQPGLRRLKDGLVDAQLKTALLEGKMNAEHPEVLAALASEKEIRAQLNAEVEQVKNNIDADLKVSAALMQSLKQQLAENEERLTKVAVLRAEYVNLLTDVKERGEVLAKTRKDLSDARASQAAALASSLITRLGQPDTGNYPIGPGKTVIVLGGFFGGLAAGLGLVFLIAPIGTFCGRRFTDYIGNGRRSTDHAAPNVANAGPVNDRRAGGQRAPVAVPEHAKAPAPEKSLPDPPVINKSRPAIAAPVASEVQTSNDPQPAAR